MTHNPQLTRAHILLAMFNQQIAEYEETGAHADRIDGLRQGQKTWAQNVTDLENGKDPYQ